MSYRTALTERLIRILFSLLRRPRTRRELAREHSVNAKTISRDLDALTLEFPISSRRRGREVEYFFAEKTNLHLLEISPEEAATMLLAQESISGIGITAEGSLYAAAAQTLLERIRKSLPVSIRRRMETLAQVYGSAAIPAKNFSAHTAFIDFLTNCAIRGKKVEMRYHSLGADARETRRIAPYAVYFDPDGATLKLIAADEKHSDLRVFSVERIAGLKETDHKFRRPADFDLKKYLTENCFNGIHGTPVRVRLKATGITARIFAERRFHPSQRIVKSKQKRGASAETVTIEMRVAGGRGLTRWVLSWLPDVEVLAPPELREEIETILRASLPEGAREKPDDKNSDKFHD